MADQGDELALLDLEVDLAQGVESGPLRLTKTISTFCTSMKRFMAAFRFSGRRS
jgi:hypothetical protein